MLKKIKETAFVVTLLGLTTVFITEVLENQKQ